MRDLATASAAPAVSAHTLACGRQRMLVRNTHILKLMQELAVFVSHGWRVEGPETYAPPSHGHCVK